jgi:ABC-type multidrug transport system permease subunit
MIKMKFKLNSLTAILVSLTTIILALALVLGEILCIYKFVKCDFNEPYKAEIIYGVSCISGFGSIVGYININDKPIEVEEK